MSNRSSFEVDNNNNINEIDPFEETFEETENSFSPVQATENEELHNINQDENDDFDDFDDFDDNFVVGTDDNQVDDDFGDFDDFEDATLNQVPEMDIPKTPTEAEILSDILENKPLELDQFMEGYLNRLWGTFTAEEDKTISTDELDILNTPCSRDLWTKLSRDTVFYNPMTGAVGQFQWTRSETNKSYLNALGVTFNHEEKPVITHKKRQSNLNLDNTTTASPSLPSTPTLTAATATVSTTAVDMPKTHTRSTSVSGGLKVVTTKMDETTKEAKKEADQELELDIDIARAYCELTEETIRIFPDVKLNAMVIELSRLQRQSAEYLDHLLDQREQLKMDAETYNDLISCIVGHAQRLHVQNKDSSPAMVTKTKKSNSFSNMMKRKTTPTTTQQSVSMGGGVVGLKKQSPTPKRTMSSNIIPTSDSRRSM